MTKYHLTAMWLAWIINLNQKMAQERKKERKKTPLRARGWGLQTINTGGSPFLSLLLIHHSLWPVVWNNLLYFSSLALKTQRQLEIIVIFSVSGHYKAAVLTVMAISKAKVAVGFIVAGVLTTLFGVILLFVGPAIMNDQIIKVGCVIV